jgi:hypothetical protein
LTDHMTELLARARSVQSAAAPVHTQTQVHSRMQELAQLYESNAQAARAMYPSTPYTAMLASCWNTAAGTPRSRL